MISNFSQISVPLPKPFFRSYYKVGDYFKLLFIKVVHYLSLLLMGNVFEPTCHLKNFDACYKELTYMSQTFSGLKKQTLEMLLLSAKENIFLSLINFIITKSDWEKKLNLRNQMFHHLLVIWNRKQKYYFVFLIL